MEAQLADPDVNSVIERLEAGKGQPCMSKIQGVETRLRSLWDDTSGATSQQLLVVL